MAMAAPAATAIAGLLLLPLLPPLLLDEM